MEILAPAGNFEAARAAVLGGADAIYVGGRVLNARRAAAGFSGEELKELVSFCTLRRVKVYVTVNTLTREDELPVLEQLVREIAEAGADGVIVADLGVARIIRSLCPTLPLHASTQMNVHTLEGVRFLEKQGFKRVVLARELSLKEISEICRNTSMEIEVFAHGALCMSCSGNCYLSAVIGQKSGNRGLCAQPCRLPYENGKYPLSLKDLSLLSRYKELKSAGIASLKIEGRLKSPEYVGSVCQAFSKAKAGKDVTAEEVQRLRHIFSRDGFTDGYITGDLGPQMFGTKTKTAYEDYKQAVSEVVKTFKEGFELKKRELSFRLSLREAYCRLQVTCEDFETTVEGALPEAAFKREVTEEDAIRALSKLGGTPFALKDCTAKVQHDLFYPAAAFNDLRRRAIEAVERHFAPVPHKIYDLPPIVGRNHFSGKPVLEGWFWEPQYAVADPRLSRYWLNGNKTAFCAPFATDPKAGVFFPVLIQDDALEKMANRLYTMGFRHALIRNIGQATLLKKMGYTVHGDFSMNLANSYALQTVSELLADATLSFELTLREIRNLPKPIPCGMIVYGRLPLMQTKNCILLNTGDCRHKKGGALCDRTGRTFPIACDYDCQNVLFNNTPLYLADRNREWQETGVTFGRLLFTDEPPTEIQKILEAYTKNSTPPEEYTRGLYYRGVY
ncbi:MAG: U32 family peptidase [Clostridia bacterium]|nr:U32 family peptidase [Clostridia bacterium]